MNDGLITRCRQGQNNNTATKSLTGISQMFANGHLVRRRFNLDHSTYFSEATLIPGRYPSALLGRVDWSGKDVHKGKLNECLQTQINARHSEWHNHML